MALIGLEIEWRKSELQKKLEAEGWKFISNFDIADGDTKLRGLSGIVGIAGRVFKPTKYELLKKYKSLYQEARLEQAHDSDANPLPFMDMAAVYIREERKKN